MRAAPRAQGPGRSHVVAALQGKDLRPRETRVAHPAHRHQRNNDVVDAGAEDAGQGNGKEDPGERQEDIHDAHHSEIYPPSRVARRATDQGSDRRGDGDDPDAHQEGGPGTHHQPIEDRTTQIVVPQQVAGGRAGPRSGRGRSDRARGAARGLPKLQTPTGRSGLTVRRDASLRSAGPVGRPTRRPDRSSYSPARRSG